MINTPISRYEEDMQQPGFQEDAAQRAAVARLQKLYEDLMSAHLAESRGFWARLWVERQKRPAEIQGVYLWGGVGRGKTYLMDIFFDSLPFDNKLRTHFHRFMRRIHSELSKLKGTANPLESVADTLSEEARVICFDEFFVSDITDAMILGGLFKALFERGVILVATSNIIPDGLYENGLQRAQFLPAIQLINQHTDVINVDGGIDYRLRALVDANLYHHPLSDEAESALMECFKALAPDHHSIREVVELGIEGRTICARYEADDVVWFDFMSICDGPRSQNDYIELARDYHSVVISGVPVMGRNNDDQARRFVNMVDEFYDRRVKLVISSEQALRSLYAGGRLSFEFERTVSRLLEMQSQEYLGLAHRP